MEPLYKDKQVTITAEYIVIRKYYFPLATSKTILMSQIEKVAMYDADLVNQKWGISSAWLNNWFPYDGERNLKKKFLEITLKGSKIKPSITPDYPEEVYKVLYDLFERKKQALIVEEKGEKPSEEEPVYETPNSVINVQSNDAVENVRIRQVYSRVVKDKQYQKAKYIYINAYS